MSYRSLLLAGLVSLTACGGGADRTADNAPATPTKQETTGPAYRTQTISLEDVKRPVQITGRVVPLQEATISSQVPGEVLPTRKLLQEGKYYRKGETIIRIDDEALRYRLQADRAKLISSLVGILSDMSIDYPDEHPTWEAYAKSIDAAELLPPLPEIENEQLGFFIATRGIPAQYYSIKAQEATLDDYLINAPFSGKLTMANVDPGAIVQPGQQLASISRTDIYEVRASVPAGVAPRLKVGKQIELEAVNVGRSYTATVNRFGTKLDRETQTVTAFLRISGDQLREGLYLEGELPGQSLESVAVLPKEALTRDGSVHLIVDSLVQLRDVEPLLVEADRVYLRGLTDGDEVITESIREPIVGTRLK